MTDEKTPDRTEHERYIRENLKRWAERIDSLPSRVNVGFVVFEVQRPAARNYGDDHLAYVLAEDAERGKFVTWLYNAASDGFAHGHYFESHDGTAGRDSLLRDAYADLRERAGLE